MTGTILLVDDDMGIRELLRSRLERAGFEVAVGADGQECVEYFQSNPLPDLVLLDVVMPRMDGLEVFEWIREEYGSDVPVVLLSGKSNDEHATTDVEPAPDARIQKPFRLPEVVTCVQDIV